MTTEELISTQTHPLKARALQVALAVWPNLGERPHWQQAELLRDVQEVLDGRAAPCVSRAERDAIKAEAARLGELGS
jgi:tRNA U34 5-methylaminomethyl-2-thiouridine-forming methyltransferase MnmC